MLEAVGKSSVETYRLILTQNEGLRSSRASGGAKFLA